MSYSNNICFILYEIISITYTQLSQILVWHTQTAKKPKPIVMVRSKATLPGSLATLLDQVTMLGIGGVSETTGGSK